MSSFVGILNVLVLFVLSLIVAFSTGLLLAKLENRQAIEPKLSEKETIEAIQCHAVHEEEGLKKRLFICVPRRMWEITKDIGKYMLIGLLLAAFLAAFVPAAIVTLILGNTGLSGLTSVLVAFPLAVIIELCSEGFAILAGQLYVMGANLAVVFTLMLVGVSTDFTELSMIFGKFGKRSMVAYVGISTAFVLLFAFALAIWWPRI
jgi:uncharacterized membrane protein YraQ (UPF0718 family)